MGNPIPERALIRRVLETGVQAGDEVRLAPNHSVIVKDAWRVLFTKGWVSGWRL